MKISILEFSVENFKVFKEKATFSMVSRKNEGHTFETNGENVLKNSFIFGPNASGKTTLLDAVLFLKTGILLSANTQPIERLAYSSFLASEETAHAPSFFEIVFSLTDSKNDGVYRYNFSILPDRIVSESFSKIPDEGKEKIYFSMNDNDVFTVETNHFEKAKEITSKKEVRKVSLLLSVLSQRNDVFAQEITSAIRNLNVLVMSAQFQDYSANRIHTDPDFKKRFMKYLEAVDFPITDILTRPIDVLSVDIKDDSTGFSANKIVEKGIQMVFKHPVFSSDKKKVGDFDLLFAQESQGTQRFISTLGPVIETLKSGGVLFIDELDNSMHPKLTKFIIDLFESEEINTKNAQLISTTHDTSLLSYKGEYIRDQFWFTDKDQYGAGKLYSLAEYKEDVRNDTEYSKKYLEGRFGALPFIKSVID